LGLSSVWVGNFLEKSVQKIIKTKFRPIVLLPIGYPNEKPDKKKMRKLKDMVFN
jgi:nitroreductase